MLSTDNPDLLLILAGHGIEGFLVFAGMDTGVRRGVDHQDRNADLSQIFVHLGIRHDGQGAQECARADGSIELITVHPVYQITAPVAIHHGPGTVTGRPIALIQGHVVIADVGAEPREREAALIV